MKTILIALLTVVSSWASSAAETIKIYSPYSVAHSATPALFKVVEQANTSQSIYRFQVEFKPGGNQTIAVRSMEPETSLSIIAAAFVENVRSGKLNKQDYVPVHAFGSACWAVITNKPLAGAKEFVAGGVGIGNTTHLTALALGEKYGFDVRYIVYKTSNEAMINMAGNHGVEIVVDRYETYQSLKTKNPSMRMVAASCPTRLPQEPNIKTLREQGIRAPYIFNIAVAHRLMPQARRVAIANILDTATKNIGAREIFELSALRPPMFDGIAAEDFYRDSFDTVEKLLNKYQSKIDSQRQ
jgi:hypothetical protein